MNSHSTATRRRFVLLAFIVSLTALVSVADAQLPKSVAKSSVVLPSIQTPTLPNTLGEQRVLVILVNFQNNPTAQPFTVEQVQNAVFGTASSFYYESSYQQMWLTGDVYGWFTIPMNSTVCNTPLLNQYANSAAAAAGANLAAYGRTVYIFPTNACTYGGSTSTGSSFSPMVDINGSLNTQIIAHELGHSFGLYHSSSMDCGSVSIGSNCTADEYGDRFDDMSRYSLYHFNAFQKDRMGWLNYGSSSAVTTVESSGTYFIEPLESLGAGGSKALKILKSVNPTTGDKTWYYMEFRQPLGFDAALSGNPNVISGVLVHYGTPVSDDFYTSFNSYLLDMTPETSSWLDPALSVGRAFQDSAAGFSATPINCSSAGCSVLVNFSSQPDQCVNSSPTVTMTPSQGAAVQPGSQVTFAVTVNNNNSGACSNATFNLQASVPPGWSATFGSSSLAMSSGASASTTLTVTSPASAAAGPYSVGVSATNSAASLYSGSASAVFNVAPPPPPPPSLSVSVSTDRPGYSLNQTVTMRGVVSAAGAPVAGATVNFTLTKSNNAIVNLSGTTGTNGTATVKYRLTKKDPKGTYHDRATTSVNGATGSAVTSFVVGNVVTNLVPQKDTQISPRTSRESDLRQLSRELRRLR